MNQYMLKHLTQPRRADKYRRFSYKKVLVDSVDKKGKKSKIISWEVYFSDVKLTTLSTVKEVKYYISTKVAPL